MPSALIARRHLQCAGGPPFRAPRPLKVVTAALAFVDPTGPILAPPRRRDFAVSHRAQVKGATEAWPPRQSPCHHHDHYRDRDLYVPDVRLGPKNPSRSRMQTAVAPLNVSVELDGSPSLAPQDPIRPGLSEVPYARGLLPWERTVNAMEGQTLTIAIQ